MSLIAGVAGCSRPAATTEAAEPVYSEQQVADAKKAVCEDFDKGYRAVQVSLSKSPDTTTTATYSSVLLNARIAELGVANMLLHSLDANPAAPPDLRDLVNQYGSLYQRIAITQLADGTAVEIDPMDAKVQELAPKIKQSCQ